MKVNEIPFNKFIGLSKSEKEDYIFELNESDVYLNHLGAVHASAQFSLAEASSGEFLFNKFKEYLDEVVPIVRRVETKYIKPAYGGIFSKAEISQEDIERVRAELNSRGRTIVKVKVNIQDSNNENTMVGTFEWFIQRIKR